MPYYTYHCERCGESQDIFRKIEDRDTLNYHCSVPMTRLIQAAHIRPDLVPFRSPVSGEWINSRKQRNEELAREGCILNEPGLKKDIARWADEREAKNLQKIDATIDQTVSELHAAGHI